MRLEDAATDTGRVVLSSCRFPSQTLSPASTVYVGSIRRTTPTVNIFHQFTEKHSSVWLGESFRGQREQSAGGYTLLRIHIMLP